MIRRKATVKAFHYISNRANNCVHHRIGFGTTRYLPYERKRKKFAFENLRILNRTSISKRVRNLKWERR